MGCKIQHNRLSGHIRQLLLDLRGVPVAGHTICLNIFIDFTIKIRNLCPSPGSASTRLGVDHQCLCIDVPFLHHRSYGKGGTSGITARICHQPRPFDLLPVQLAEPVHRLFDELAAFMLDSIPFFIYRHIFDPEIRTQVDHLALTENFLVNHRGKIALRGRRKDYICLPAKGMKIVPLAQIFYDLKHIAKYTAEFFIHIAFGTIPYDLCFLML